MGLRTISIHEYARREGRLGEFCACGAIPSDIIQNYKRLIDPQALLHNYMTCECDDDRR